MLLIKRQEPTWARYAPIAPRETASPTTVLVHAKCMDEEADFTMRFSRVLSGISRPLNPRESTLAYRVALEYALRVPINRASRSPGFSSLRIVHIYTYTVSRHRAFPPAYHQIPDLEDPEESRSTSSAAIT